MIRIIDKNRCCGCTACVNVCAHGCISMNEDSEGFLYPKVDEDHCVDCHLCDRVCPYENIRIESLEIDPECISAKAKDDEIRFKSSSGGLFSLLAQVVINQQGIVYGAAFDKNFHVIHRGVDSIQRLDLLRGSKYVQSETGFTFSEVKKWLKEGRKVMYVGTPCQIEGLYNYLGNKKTDNLILVDFVCHGVPSPKVWNLYLEDIRKRYNSKIECIFFRDKSHGWKTYSLTFQSESMPLQSRILTFDHYMQTFLRDISLRPSCYNCVCKKINRVSDVTLADFWGIRRINKAMNDDKGVSLVLLHSEKGKRLFQKIESDIEWYNESLASVKKINHNMVQSVKEPQKRETFFRNIDRYSFEELYDKTVRRGVMYELKNRIKGYLKLILHLLEI